MSYTINDPDKLQNFSRLVCQQAIQHRDCLLSHLAQEKQKRMDEAEMQGYASAYKQIQSAKADLSRTSNEQLSRMRLEAKMQLSSRREQIVSSVFQQVFEKLHAFIKSEQYYPWLVSKCREAAALLGGRDIVLYVNHSDEAYRQRLTMDTGFTVQILSRTEDIIGGVYALHPSTHRKSDRTITTLFEEEKQHFLTTSGLRI